MVACFLNIRQTTEHEDIVGPLAKERCKLDIRKYAFSQRTINEWNRLPGECVNANSVNMFKNKIVNYFKRYG